MKKIKVFFNGERLRDMYPYATKWEVFKWKLGKLLRKVVLVTIAAIVVYSAGVIGSEYFPKTVYHVEAQKVVTVEVEKEVESAVMTRIAKCESGGSHYAKNGQVLVVGNTNKTVDIGLYQINEYYWGAKATELGLNLFDEEDNIEFAHWLYAEKGTEPWIHSRTCWSK